MLLALIAIFVAAKLFGEIAERIGQPAVLGELFGGVIIGVSGLHLVDPHDVTIHLLSELGVILLLFLIGLETDLHKLMQVGGSAVAVAVVGVTLPFLGGAALGHFLGFSLIFAQIGLTTKLISGGMYSAVALMVMLTTFIAPPLLRRLLVQGTPGELEGGSAEYVVDAPMDRDE